MPGVGHAVLILPKKNEDFEDSSVTGHQRGKMRSPFCGALANTSETEFTSETGCCIVTRSQIFTHSANAYCIPTVCKAGNKPVGIPCIPRVCDEQGDKLGGRC